MVRTSTKLEDSTGEREVMGDARCRLRRRIAAGVGVLVMVVGGAQVASGQEPPPEGGEATVPSNLSDWMVSATGMGIGYTFDYSSESYPATRLSVPYVSALATPFKNQGVASLFYPGPVVAAGNSAFVVLLDNVPVIGGSPPPQVGEAGAAIQPLVPPYPFHVDVNAGDKQVASVPEIATPDGSARASAPVASCKEKDHGYDCTGRFTGLVVGDRPPGGGQAGLKAQGASLAQLRNSLRILGPAPKLRTGEAGSLVYAGSVVGRATAAATDKATATVNMTMADVSLAGGALQIDSVKLKFESVNDGNKVNSKEPEISIGEATVNGVPVRFDRKGLVVDDAAPMGTKEREAISKTLNEAFGAAGFTFQMLTSGENTDPGSPGTNGNGVLMTWKGEVPQFGPSIATVFLGGAVTAARATPSSALGDFTPTTPPSELGGQEASAGVANSFGPSFAPDGGSAVRVSEGTDGAFTPSPVDGEPFSGDPVAFDPGSAGSGTGAGSADAGVGHLTSGSGSEAAAAPKIRSTPLASTKAAMAPSGGGANRGLTIGLYGLWAMLGLGTLVTLARARLPVFSQRG